MADLENTLTEILKLQGAVAVALVDTSTGMPLGVAGDEDTFDVELGAAGSTDVLRSQLRTMEALGITSEVEDILVTLEDQYHVIRAMRQPHDLFLWTVLSRRQANLALARLKLGDLAGSLEI